MKTLFQTCLLLWLASTSFAEEASSTLKVLRVCDWKDLPAQFPQCQIISTNGVSVLKIENTNDAPLEVPLVTLADASLLKNIYKISWEMKYENVEQKKATNNNIRRSGFSLNGSEMKCWEIFPPVAVGGDETTNQGGFYFTGTHNWERHEINSFRPGRENSPRQLELKWKMPRGGTVYLRPIEIYGYVPNWWLSQQAGLIGGIGGSVIGCLGGLIGILASTGRARRFVLTTAKILIALGIFSLISGVAALALKQPYAVYYPLLLAGFILTIVFSVNLPAIQRRYDELEIRRMTSEDSLRG